jgi:hypothetical protein
MSSYDDVHYLAVMKFKLATITAGDPQTAFNNLIDQAWEIAAKTGNIKDLDATQEANFKTWLQNWARIAWDIAAQSMLRPFLAAVTESSTTTTTAGALAIWKQSDWDAFVSSLEKLDCPDFIYRFLDPFLWYLKLTEPYEKAGLEIPPSYFLPIMHVGDLEDMETLREAAKGVSSNAMIHCKKFGIPFSKFSSSKLKAAEIKKSSMWTNLKCLAYFNLVYLKYYDDGSSGIITSKHVSCLTGANVTTDYTNIVYAFFDGQAPGLLHAMFPLFGTYNADFNDIGGIFETYNPNTNEYEFSIFLMKLLGTSWDFATIDVSEADSSMHLLKLFASFYSSAANYGIGWTGTAVTADQLTDFNDWIWFDVVDNLMIGDSVSYGEIHDSAMNAIKYCLYGE